MRCSIYRLPKIFPSRKEVALASRKPLKSVTLDGPEKFHNLAILSKSKLLKEQGIVDGQLNLARAYRYHVEKENERFAAASEGHSLCSALHVVRLNFFLNGTCIP